MKCTCGHPDNYNYAIDNGLCNSCIAEKLEQLEERLVFADKHIGWLKADKTRLNRSIKLRNNAFDALIKITDKEVEQLKAENKRLREYIQTIGKYAYAQHGDTKADAHSELYQIATMCRDEQVEQALKGIKP